MHTYSQYSVRSIVLGTDMARREEFQRRRVRRTVCTYVRGSRACPVLPCQARLGYHPRPFIHSCIHPADTGRAHPVISHLLVYSVLQSNVTTHVAATGKGDKIGNNLARRPSGGWTMRGKHSFWVLGTWTRWETNGFVPRTGGFAGADGEGKGEYGRDRGRVGDFTYLPTENVRSKYQTP